MPRLSRIVAPVTAALLGAGVLAAAPAQAADPVDLNLIGINDFHGRIDANTVKWAGTIESLRAEGGSANSVLVSAGDNVSASLFASAVQDDNPTIDVLNEVGLDASATGNHEFDKGYDDLVNRIQPRADFPILGANVYKADGSRALPAYEILDAAGLKVAVVGAVTQETPTLVSPDGVTGLTFTDPSEGINSAVAELDALPEAEQPDVVVAAYHEGAPDGTQTFEQAMASSVVFQRLVTNTSAEVDAIFMGHTHQKYAYDAPIPGGTGTRPVIQTGNYGENVGNISLSVDPDTGDVVDYSLRNVPRLTTDDATLIAQYPSLAQVKKTTDDALAYAAQVGNTPKGRITADITTAYTGTTRDDRANESTLGNLVADALLAKVGENQAGADIGIVNPGGLRAELLYKGDTAGNPENTDGVVTYAEANAVLPFVNNLSSVAMKGATVEKVLEQQWQRDANGNVPSRAYLQLGLSKNVHYTYDPALAEGSRITSVTIDGAPLNPEKTYKVATFSFLAAGGDNFTAFKEGTLTDTGLVDYEAWIDYLSANQPLAPDFARRSVQVTAPTQTEFAPGDTVSLSASKLDLTSLGSPRNTTVTGTVTAGSVTEDLGSFPVTDGKVSPSFALPDLPGGPATLTFTAQPSGTTFSVPIAVEVTETTTTATAPQQVAADKTFVVKAAVTSDDGTVPGTVTVKSGTTTVGTAALVDGRADVTVDARKLGAGTRKLTVAYAGSGAFQASSTSVTVEVVKHRTPLELSSKGGAYGRPFTIQVAAGDPKASGLLYAAKGSKVVGLGYLSRGKGTVHVLPYALKPGTHTLTVGYPGGFSSRPGWGTITVDVTKR